MIYFKTYVPDNDVNQNSILIWHIMDKDILLKIMQCGVISLIRITIKMNSKCLNISFIDKQLKRKTKSDF